MLHCNLFYKEKLLQQSNNSHLLTFYCDQINHEWLKKHELPTIVHFTWMHICLFFSSIKKKILIKLRGTLKFLFYDSLQFGSSLAAFSFAFNDVYAANSMRVCQDILLCISWQTFGQITLLLLSYFWVCWQSICQNIKH